MIIHCRDCHEKKEQHKEASTDLCDGCWKARLALLEQRKAGLITHEEFVYAQHGKTRRQRIDEVLKVQS